MHVNPVGNTKDIYVIKNDLNDKLYVGQSKNPEKRFKERCTTSKSKKDKSAIDYAIAKYGREHFSYDIIESDVENFNEREMYWISELNTISPNGYNILKGGQDPPHYTGYDNPSAKLTEEDVNNIIHDLMYTYDVSGVIAKKYGVGDHVISRINAGVSSYCPKDISYPIRDWKSCGEQSNVSYEDVTNIITLIKESDLSMSEIARQYGVDKSLILGISNGSYKKYRRSTEVYPLRPPANNGKPTLTKEQVDEVIYQLKTTRKTFAVLALEYNTNDDTICRINSGSCDVYRKVDEVYPIRPFEGFKFTKEDIDNIIHLLKNTTTPIKHIAKQYNVDDKSIALIRDGITEVYRRLNETYPLRPPSNKRDFLTDEEVTNIINDIKNTSEQLKDIAKKYNVRQSTISGIVHGNAYKRPTETYPLR